MTAETEESLGQILIEAGQVQEGVEMLVHALQVYHAQLGPEHPSTQRLMQIPAPVLGQGGE